MYVYEEAQVRRTGGPTVAYSQNVWTEQGKMNVRRHELRHFNTINLTFSTDFTSLMCSGVQTNRKKKTKTLISWDAGTGRSAQLRDEIKFHAEKLSDDASRTNLLRNVFMYSHITVLMSLQIRKLSHSHPLHPQRHFPIQIFGVGSLDHTSFWEFPMPTLQRVSPPTVGRI